MAGRGFPATGKVRRFFLGSFAKLELSSTLGDGATAGFSVAALPLRFGRSDKFFLATVPVY